MTPHVQKAKPDTPAERHRKTEDKCNRLLVTNGKLIGTLAVLIHETETLLRSPDNPLSRHQAREAIEDARRVLGEGP